MLSPHDFRRWALTLCRRAFRAARGLHHQLPDGHAAQLRPPRLQPRRRGLICEVCRRRCHRREDQLVCLARPCGRAAQQQ